jgi:hypothetical protein
LAAKEYAFSSRCRISQRCTTCLSFALFILLSLERFGWIVAPVLSGHAISPNRARLIGSCLDALPDAFFLLALWWIRNAFSSLAAGDFFASTLTRTLRGVGLCVFIGAVMKTVIVPSIERFLGCGPGYWIALDTAAYALAVLGLALTVLAHVLEAARKLKAELDDIF